MSSFNGEDIFNSSTYPSRFTVGPYKGRNILMSIPGVDGAFSNHLGIAPRGIAVEGILGASSKANLSAAIATILGYVNGSTYTLVDNSGWNYNYCQLASFEYGNVPGGQNSRITQTGAGDFITYYRARFIQVSPYSQEA